MIRKLGLFATVTLASWLIVCVMVRSFIGDDSALACAVAFGICWVPAFLTFAWSAWALERGAPEQRLAAILGGGGIRMLAVGGTAIFLNERYAFLNSAGFPGWVLGFFLLLLTLEIVLLLSTLSAKMPASSQARPGGG